MSATKTGAVGNLLFPRVPFDWAWRFQVETHSSRHPTWLVVARQFLLWIVGPPFVSVFSKKKKGLLNACPAQSGVCSAQTWLVLLQKVLRNLEVQRKTLLMSCGFLDNSSPPSTPKSTSLVSRSLRGNSWHLSFSRNGSHLHVLNCLSILPGSLRYQPDTPHLGWRTTITWDRAHPGYHVPPGNQGLLIDGTSSFWALPTLVLQIQIPCA